jgi:hypothetical protein
MKNPHNLKAGQELFLVPNWQRGHKRTVVIEKIGRIWATLAGYEGRIDMGTLIVDGGEYMSPATCYLSEEDYRKKIAKTELWDKIRREISNNFQPQIDYKSMMIIADCLGINTSD